MISENENMSNQSERVDLKMIVCTFYVPEEFVEAGKILIGKKGIYPSRSEMNRVMLRGWIKQILPDLKNRLPKRILQLEEQPINLPEQLKSLINLETSI